MKNSDKKLPPQVKFNFMEEELVNLDTDETNPNFVYEGEESNDLKEIEFQEKPVINKKEIFEGNDTDEEIVDEEIVHEEHEPEPAPASKPKKEKPPPKEKEKKKRKPMTEEHKAKLFAARDKAMKVRKANAEERKKMKAVDIEEQDLLKKQKIKRVKKLKEEVDSDHEETIIKPIKQTSQITKKDLEDAQLDAIIKYEAMRKERKAEKKKAELVENERLNMINTINKATGGSNYRYKDGSNRFDNCY
tara:strand:+ start:1032 stop:1772 length:741 start_codon:yes stop_codon:yes gene_type:complete